MTVDVFWAAADQAVRQRSELADPALLPTRLACAAAAVLGADGAGLSLTAAGPDLRVPLGSSSQDAVAAERLQFTTGEGPCLEALHHQEPIMAGEAVMVHAWPVFAGRLLHQTPFRSIFAAPVRKIGAMDVYFTDPSGCLTVDVGQALRVCEWISGVLTDPGLGLAVTERMLAGPAAARRHQINIAMGMITQELCIDFAAALAALRAHAFATDSDIEDVTAAVIAQTMLIADLLP